MQNLHICKICVYANLGHVYTALVALVNIATSLFISFSSIDQIGGRLRSLPRTLIGFFFQHDTTGIVFVAAPWAGPDRCLPVYTGGVWWAEYDAGAHGNFTGHRECS